MLFLFDSRVTYIKPIPQYKRPIVTPVIKIDDDDDIFLATWYMFLSHVYRKDNK